VFRLVVLSSTNCCVFSVSIYWTENICCMRSFFRSWNVHIAVCGLSFGTVLYSLLCMFFLSVLNRTHCCLWFPDGIEMYKLRYVVCLYWVTHIAVCGRYVYTEMSKFLFVVCLSILNFKYWRVWTFCLYWTVHISVCGRTVCIELYTMLWVVPLSALNWAYCSVCSPCRYWLVQIAVFVCL